MKKTDVAVIGATGIVGQRLLKLLSSHPRFRVAALFAGEKSEGKTLQEALLSRRCFREKFPDEIENMTVLKTEPKLLSNFCDVAFCAAKLPEDKTRALEEELARREVKVISLNSACRMLPDVPMIIPEINLSHLDVIPFQRKRLLSSRGFIVTKCNCALLSFVPLLTPLLPLGLERVRVTTLQAISGAGETFQTAPNLKDNVLPFIAGEEKKCETEPKKIWGRVQGGRIKCADFPLSIRAQCFRVPLSDGHFAAVDANFTSPVSREEIIERFENFNKETFLKFRAFPSSPEKFITLFEDESRPQPLFDLYAQKGMGVEAGRLSAEGKEVRFVGLSHNTVRGAAGGALLLAEVLKDMGYLD